MSPARDITTTQTGADGPGAAGGQHAMMGPRIAGGTADHWLSGFERVTPQWLTT
jgi:hypothetical protein